MTQRVLGTDVLDRLSLVEAGIVVNQQVDVPTNHVSEAIMSTFHVLYDWELGKDALRKKYLRPLNRAKAGFAPSQSYSAGVVTDEKQPQATKILRQWAMAPDKDCSLDAKAWRNFTGGKSARFQSSKVPQRFNWP